MQTIDCLHCKEFFDIRGDIYYLTLECPNCLRNLFIIHCNKDYAFKGLRREINFTHNGYEITVALHDNNIYITKNFYNTLADIPPSSSQQQQPFYKIEVGKFRIIFKDIIDWDAVPSEINIKKEYVNYTLHKVKLSLLGIVYPESPLA